MIETKQSGFFLGANTPNGFTSLFADCYTKSFTVFILKGTPGSGKSTMMKKIAATFPLSHELIYCSSDPDSLDGIIFPNEKICVLDGTSPHVRNAKTQKNRKTDYFIMNIVDFNYIVQKEIPWRFQAPWNFFFCF